MPKTKVKENMNYYNRVLNRDFDRVQDGAYKNVLDKLRILMERTEDLFQKGEDGRFRQMDEKGYRSLMSAYQEMDKACSEYFEDSRKKENLDQSRAHIVKRLRGYVSKDLSCLEGLDRNHLPTLPDAIRQARTVQTDLTGKKLSTVGAVQSTRIPLKSANGRTGFFTERSGFDKQKSWEKMIDGILPIVPEKFRESFVSMRNDKSRRDNFWELMNEYSRTFMTNDRDGRQEVLTEMYREITKENLSEAEKDQLEGCLWDMEKSSRGFRLKEDHIETTGIESSERMDQRNSAMSAVADLLGSSQLLARAMPMTILHDGKVIEGTFMESAQGTDIHHPGRQDLWLQGKKNINLGEPGTLKQLAELQVLDYICGNIDRHPGNMLYQFEEKDGKVCLSKITGIDNDDSFGTNLFNEEDTGFRYQPGVKEMKVISARQANVIQNLNRDILKETLLPYELTDHEIEACWDRIGCLKKEINRGNIAVVKDSEWKDKKLSELSGKSNNIFARIQKVPQELSFSLNSPGLMNEKPLQFAEGEKAQDTRQQQIQMEQSHNKLMLLIKQIRDADRNLYINSTEFREMRNSLYQLGKFSKDLKEKYPEDSMEMSQEDRQELTRHYTKLKEVSEAYIDAKKLSPKTEHGKLRLYLANEIHDLAADSCDFLEEEKEIQL